MKKLMLVSVVAVSALGLGACSSTPTQTTTNEVKFQKDETLSTMNDKSQPEWADEGQPFVIKGGKVFSVGVTTLRGDERPEAGMRISENNARANFSKAIENRMEFIFQGSEENASFDSTQAKWIGSEASNLVSHSMTVGGHWWKRYAQSSEDGSRHIYYKIYSLVTMPESDLKQAIYSAVHKGESQHKLSENFQKQVDGQWDRFVEGKTDTAKADDRHPSKSSEPTQVDNGNE